MGQTHPTSLYTEIGKIVNGRSLLSVNRFCWLKNPTMGKEVFLFGENHGLLCETRGETISVYKLVRQLIGNDVCPTFDIIVETNPLLMKYPGPLSIRDETSRSLNPRNLSENVIHNFQYYQMQMLSGKIPNNPNCVVRLHYVDLRRLVGLDSSMLISIDSLLSKQDDPSLIKLMIKLYIPIVEPFIISMYYTAQSILNREKITSFFTTLLTKQIAKIPVEYKDTMWTYSEHVVNDVMHKTREAIAEYRNSDSKDDHIYFRKLLNVLVRLSAKLVDLYTIARILKLDPDNDEYMKNIIVYMGNAHIGHVLEGLSYFGFEILVNRSEKKPNCIQIYDESMLDDASEESDSEADTKMESNI